MQHHTLVICPVPTGLILSFQYEIVTYLYIEHKITGFTKLPDTGGYGEFFTKKAGYKRVWIWPSGVERGGSQNFNPRTAGGGGGTYVPPPIGFSQIAEKWRRAAPPNLA